MSRLEERIENFNRAFEIYSEAVKDFSWNRILSHMALIQSFEVCFELAWKVLKDYIETKGIKVDYPKDVIKESFNKNTIKNGQEWFDMLETMNSTSHEYNMEKVHTMLEKISTEFYDELYLFSNKVKEFLNA